MKSVIEHQQSNLCLHGVFFLRGVALTVDGATFVTPTVCLAVVNGFVLVTKPRSAVPQKCSRGLCAAINSAGRVIPTSEYFDNPALESLLVWLQLYVHQWERVCSSKAVAIAAGPLLL